MKAGSPRANTNSGGRGRAKCLIFFPGTDLNGLEAKV